jgi:hypothetical protein
LGSLRGGLRQGSSGTRERLAIFVGLWPPTFFLLGKVLQDIEATPDEQVSQARGAEATRKAKEAVPA